MLLSNRSLLLVFGVRLEDLWQLDATNVVGKPRVTGSSGEASRDVGHDPETEIVA